MAKGDVEIVKSPYRDHPVIEMVRVDRTTTSDTVVYPGEPLKIGANNDVIHLATGDPEIGTDLMVGISQNESTETATANGTVNVYVPVPGTVYRCAATDSSNLAAGIIYDAVTFDLTGTTYTVDENEGSDPDVHGLIILDYDTDTGKIDFIINTSATLLSGLV